MGSKFKRLLFAATMACALAIAAPAASATSPGPGSGGQPADFNFNGANATENMWTGLCLGASLDISMASQRQCERSVQKQRPPIQDGPTVTCTQDE